jgi:hypothetical protein
MNPADLKRQQWEQSMAQWAMTPRQQQAAEPAAPKKQKGKGGTLTSFISELGGTGGAALGATIGSVVPGIGTLIGGGIGGLIGGFGGRLAENKIRDDRYGLSQALQEGALSGALSLIPGGKSVATASGKTGSKLLGKTVVKEGQELAAENIGKLGKVGGYLRSTQRGITPGMPIKGGILGTAEAKAQNAILDESSKMFKGIGKSQQFTQLEKKMSQYVKEYAGSKEAAQKFSKANADDVIARFKANIADNPSLAGGFKGQGAKTRAEIIKQIQNLSGKQNKDFIELVSGKINPRYKVSASGGNAGSIESQIYEAARDAMKGHIDDTMGTRSALNKKFSTLIGAQQNLSKTIGRDLGAGASQGYSLGRTLSNVAGPSLDVLGRGMQQAGKVTNSTLARQGVRQVGGRSALGGQAPQEQLMQEPMDQQPQETIYGGPGAEYAQQQMGGQDMMGGQMMEQPQEPTYTLADALSDSRRDPRNASQYLAYAKAFEAQNKAAKPSVKAQDAQAAGSQALNIIDNLEQAFNQAGGGQGRIGGTLSSLRGKAGFNDSVKVYEDAKLGFLSNVARSLGEKGVLTDVDIERVGRLFPGPTATPQEAARKWAMIKTIISSGVQKARSAYEPGSQLTGLISEYGGQ